MGRITKCLGGHSRTQIEWRLGESFGSRAKRTVKSLLIGWLLIGLPGNELMAQELPSHSPNRFRVLSPNVQRNQTPIVATNSAPTTVKEKPKQASNPPQGFVPSENPYSVFGFPDISRVKAETLASHAQTRQPTYLPSNQQRNTYVPQTPTPAPNFAPRYVIPPSNSIATLPAPYDVFPSNLARKPDPQRQLRTAARQLDTMAAQFEAAGLYQEADEVREQSNQFWKKARTVGEKELTKARVPVTTKLVVAASRHLKIDQKLTGENLVLESWPEKLVPDGAFDSLEELKGKFAGARMHQGMAIVESNVRKNISIPPGYKVVTAKLDESDAGWALLTVGDKVDVISKSKDQAKTILKSVRVFSIQRPNIFSLSGPNQITVGLLVVDGKQSEELVAAMNSGEIQLVRIRKQSR